MREECTEIFRRVYLKFYTLGFNYEIKIQSFPSLLPLACSPHIFIQYLKKKQATENLYSANNKAICRSHFSEAEKKKIVQYFHCASCFTDLRVPIKENVVRAETARESRLKKYEKKFGKSGARER